MCNNISPGLGGWVGGKKVRSSCLQRGNKHGESDASSVFFFMCFAVMARWSEAEGFDGGGAGQTAL